MGGFFLVFGWGSSVFVLLCVFVGLLWPFDRPRWRPFWMMVGKRGIVGEWRGGCTEGVYVSGGDLEQWRPSQEGG